jgi:MFS transporter, AAHS family, 4-hydroxybenzoate transporter
MSAVPLARVSSPVSSTPVRSRIIILVCFLVALIDGYDTLMLSFIAPLISKEWAMPPGDFGKVFSAGFAGAAIGAFTIGAAADRFGRRNLLILSIVISGVLTIACAWSDGAPQLMLLRFLSGLGLGGAIPTVSALAAAHARADRRTVAVSRMFLGFPIGAIAGGAITAALMHVVGWRGIFIGGGIVTLLLLPLSLVVTDARNGEPAGEEAVRSTRPLSRLVADGRLPGTVLLCAATFLILLVSYFLISWTPTVLTLNGMNPQRAALAAVVLNVGGVVGVLGMSFVIANRSPFRPIALSLGVCAVLIPVFGFFVAATGPAAFLLIFLLGLLLIGGQMNMPALCVHFFPAEVRATGVGLSMAVGRLGSIAGPLLGGTLVSAHLAWSQLFLLAALPTIAAAVAMSFIGRTSRRG